MSLDCPPSSASLHYSASTDFLIHSAEIEAEQARERAYTSRGLPYPGPRTLPAGPHPKRKLYSEDRGIAVEKEGMTKRQRLVESSDRMDLESEINSQTMTGRNDGEYISISKLELGLLVEEAARYREHINQSSTSFSPERLQQKLDSSEQKLQDGMELYINHLVGSDGVS